VATATAVMVVLEGWHDRQKHGSSSVEGGINSEAWLGCSP
jgi:hypothetical protein